MAGPLSIFRGAGASRTHTKDSKRQPFQVAATSRAKPPEMPRTASLKKNVLETT